MLNVEGLRRKAGLTIAYRNGWVKELGRGTWLIKFFQVGSVLANGNDIVSAKQVAVGTFRSGLGVTALVRV